jgi:2-polyprenyl-3-methyl-5-hydroxy-6-metoxy-1,4-benzoquinol methylase
MTDAADPWAEAATDWDTNPAVVAYADAAHASLVDAVALQPTDRVLDFGCGTGLLTERIAPAVAEVVAVDASPAMVAGLAAKGLPDVVPVAATWTAETVATDPLAADGFDLIVCSSVLAFVPDYPGAVAMLAGLLRPGGRFVQWDWEPDPTAEEPGGLTPEAIAAALAAAGLQVVSVGRGFDVPFEGQRMRPLMGVGGKAG